MKAPTCATPSRCCVSGGSASGIRRRKPPPTPMQLGSAGPEAAAAALMGTKGAGSMPGAGRDMAWRSWLLVAVVYMRTGAKGDDQRSEVRCLEEEQIGKGLPF